MIPFYHSILSFLTLTQSSNFPKFYDAQSSMPYPQVVFLFNTKIELIVFHLHQDLHISAFFFFKFYFHAYYSHNHLFSPIIEYSALTLMPQKRQKKK